MSSADEWDIGVVWLSRRLHRPDRMLRRRIEATRRGGRGRGPDTSPLELLVDGCAVDGLAVVVAVVVVVALVILFVSIGPGLLAVTIGIIEILILLLASFVAFVIRVIFRRPWEVLARSGTEQLAWRAPSFGAARRLVDELEAAVAHGFHPGEIAPHQRDPDAALADESPPAMYQAAEFRHLGRVFGLVVAVPAIVGVLLVLGLIAG